MRIIPSAALAATLTIAGTLEAQGQCPPQVRRPVYSQFNGQFATQCLISPDGKSVVFLRRTRDNLVRQLWVGTATSENTQTIHSFPLGWNSEPTFFFDLSGQTLYFTAEGNAMSPANTASIRRVAIANGRTQGSISTLHTTTSSVSMFRIVGMDNSPSLVFGSLRQGQSTQDIIFSMPAAGGLVQLVFLLSNTMNLRLHDVAPGPRRLLCSETSRSAPGTYQYFDIDSGGKNRFNVGSAIAQTTPQIEFASWFAPGSAGSMLAHTTNAIGRDQIIVHGGAFNLHRLTDGIENRLGLSEGGIWTAYMKEVKPALWEPAIIKSLGGGEIELAAGTPSIVWPPLPCARPTFDASGLRVAWVYGGNCWTTELDRELAIGDRAQIGQNVNVTLTLTSGEAGACVIASGLVSPGITIPGLCGTYDLNASGVTLFTAANATATFGLQIPFDFALVGQTLFFQAGRSTGVTGDFTRVARMRIFF